MRAGSGRMHSILRCACCGARDLDAIGFGRRPTVLPRKEGLVDLVGTLGATPSRDSRACACGSRITPRARGARWPPGARPRRPSRSSQCRWRRRPAPRPHERHAARALQSRQAALGAPLCLGIDPHPDALPDGLAHFSPDVRRSHCRLCRCAHFRAATPRTGVSALARASLHGRAAPGFRRPTPVDRAYAARCGGRHPALREPPVRSSVPKASGRTGRTRGRTPAGGFKDVSRSLHRRGTLVPNMLEVWLCCAAIFYRH